MADLLVRVRVGAYISDVIGRRFEKVKNGHRFENLKRTQICDVTIGHGFEDWMSIRGWT